MRSGLLFFNASWFGPVRFDLVPRPVPAGSRIKRFGSVRPVRFGVLFPSAVCSESLLEAVNSWKATVDVLMV